MPFTADELLRRHSRLLTERVLWESHWREVVRYVLPRSDFFQGRAVPGDKHTEKLFDATACLALERFTARMESINGKPFATRLVLGKTGVRREFAEARRGGD